MKKVISTLFSVLIIVGIAGIISSYKPAMLAFKGTSVNLNEATTADFKKPAKIEGEIYCVYDCVAVEEITRKSYGIKTGTDKTNFYLIETCSKEQYETGGTDEDDEYKSLTVLYATSNDDTIKKLDSMVKEWYDYDEQVYKIYESATTEEELDKILEIKLPEQTFTLSGMIDKYEDMNKLNDYRDEYITELMGYSGEELEEYIDEYCVDMIIKTIDVDRSKLIFIISIVMSALGVIGLIFSLVLSKKRNVSEEFY